jgi:hypothetical protein
VRRYAPHIRSLSRGQLSDPAPLGNCRNGQRVDSSSPVASGIEERFANSAKFAAASGRKGSSSHAQRDEGTGASCREQALRRRNYPFAV